MDLPLNSNQIQAIIPHRYPFLLVDRIIELEIGRSAKGIKCVTANEGQFAGHFPSEHVMPGVLMVEALAQVGAVALMSQKENQGKIAYFAGINKCRFRRKVIPGDVLELSVTIKKMKMGIGFGDAVATVDGEIAVEAELMFSIPIEAV